MTTAPASAKGTLPCAVVVGVCAHGLALVRSLARSGIDVHIVEADTSLPGLLTGYGVKHLVEDINGDELVPALLQLRRAIAPQSRPVLFLTNDRMVRAVAGCAERVAAAFRLSWAASAAKVRDLTSKHFIEERCKETGLNYPSTVMLDRLDDLLSLNRPIRWPQIIKPSRPLSSFKVKVVESATAASDFLRHRLADFPVLLQQWIPGDDTRIHFSALFLERGVPLARFDGRKLRSFPMGHTTVAEPFKDDAVFEYAARFFAGTGITGPASLEVKRDHNGLLWVIEPTVGRTDFWLDLCISNGVDLPVIEFLHQTEHPLPRSCARNSVVWINAERDPIALPWYLFNVARATRFMRCVRFTYLDLRDIRPFLRATKKRGINLLRSIAKRFGLARAAL